MTDSSSSSAAATGAASLVEETDDFDNLDLSFDDLGAIGVDEQADNGGSTEDFLKKPPAASYDNDDLCKKKPPPSHRFGSDYILGTLIVRVVAARDLEPVAKGGLGKMIFGSSNKGSSQGRGSANPYASVRFGTTTQRTTEVFDTIDPIWPRGEAMYMDVTHRGMPEAPVAMEYDGGTASPYPDPDPLKKSTSFSSKSTSPKATVSKAAARAHSQSPRKKGPRSDSAASVTTELTQPILTVALFHASEIGKAHKLAGKKGALSGDSDDVFLGMTAIDLTHLLTGKIRTVDEWLPLNGSNSPRASVRLVCEYEASDSAPRAGDLVRFTGFCHPADLYPLQVDKSYIVEESDGDNILLSCTSPEGWVSSFLAHRFMVVCEERHQAVMEHYQEELASIKDRLSHSPLVNVVSENVSRIPDEGLVSIAQDAFKGGTTLLNRWLNGGVETAVGDLAFATNWDGRFNPDLSESAEEEQERPAPSAAQEEQEEAYEDESESFNEDPNYEPLPNMPSCPITGEPMRDPVVAADGHTYERAAISRWLKTSNKSPLSGMVLPHKNLVPNYMLLSSLQEAATAIEEPAPTPVIMVEGVEEEDMLSIENFDSREE